jgi:site-specific DNA-methyltransferase (adenine-specific)
LTLELNKIYCGDCLDLMREMPDKSVDLVLTDPPYGIKADTDAHKSSGLIKGQKTGFCTAARTCYDYSNWDNSPPTKAYFDEMIRISENQIFFGGNFFDLPPSPCWIIWDKETNGYFADAELAWTSFNTAVRIFKWRWNGLLQEDMAHKEKRVHPTQKPLPLMMWCLEKYSKPGMTVLDPFLGSGTTAVACKKLGRNYIGIEKEPAYVEIALKRLEKVNNHKITDFFSEEQVEA